MAMEHGQLPSGSLESVCAKILQSQKKESHVCEYADSKKGKKRYSKYCREHKAIGKITAGRIARQKAIEKIAARDKSNYASEVKNPIIYDEIHLNSKDQIGLLLSGVVLIFYSLLVAIPQSISNAPESSPFTFCLPFWLGICLMVSSVRGFTSFLFVAFFTPLALMYGVYLFLETMFFGPSVPFAGWGGP